MRDIQRGTVVPRKLVCALRKGTACGNVIDHSASRLVRMAQCRAMYEKGKYEMTNLLSFAWRA
jgi:hypothetical protein